MQTEFNTAVTFVPSASHRFLPGCRACGLRHPRAMQPPLDQDNCVGCGRILTPGPVVDVPAVLTVPRMARAFLWLARLLTSLSKRL